MKHRRAGPGPMGKEHTVRVRHGAMTTVRSHKKGVAGLAFEATTPDIGDAPKFSNQTYLWRLTKETGPSSVSQKKPGNRVATTHKSKRNEWGGD